MMGMFKKMTRFFFDEIFFFTVVFSFFYPRFMEHQSVPCQESTKENKRKKFPGLHELLL